MRTWKLVAIGFAFLLTLVGYTNCAKKNFDSKEVAADPGGPLSIPDPPDTPDIPDVPGDTSDKCKSQTNKVLKQTITFEDPKQYCPWGQDDNAKTGDNGKLNNYIQARIEQRKTINALPTSTEICDLKFNFKNVSGANSKFYYDDHFIFTFNNIVLAATHNQIVNKFSSQDGLFSYDWQKIVGMTGDGGGELVGASEVYCPGLKEGHSQCGWPKTETTGNLSIAIDPAIIQRISDLRSKADLHEFAFITTGDNDDAQTVNGQKEPKDCRHSEISFEVEIQYVE